MLKKPFLGGDQLFSRFAEFEIRTHLPINTVEKVDFILELIGRQYSIEEKSNNRFFTKFVKWGCSKFVQRSGKAVDVQAEKENCAEYGFPYSCRLLFHNLANSH